MVLDAERPDVWDGECKAENAYQDLQVCAEHIGASRNEWRENKQF